MHERLTDLFRRREIDKRYWAMVKGVPEPRQGIVNIPLAEVELGDGRHRMTGKRMIYCPSPKFGMHIFAIICNGKGSE